MGKKIDSAKPVIFDRPEAAEQIEQLIKSNNPKLIDIYDNQVSELTEILNPSNEITIKVEATAVHIYLPWSNTLLRCVDSSSYYSLRTNRNKNLITESEQNLINNCTLAIAGMSVGSSIAIAAAYTGLGENIHIADMDTLSTTNLNRVRMALADIGRNKVDVVAEQLFEINPYLNISTFYDGVTTANLDSFASSTSSPLFIFDEIDDFSMKVQLRIKARQLKRPLLMLTGLGDSVLIDIERYDLNDNYPLFHGLVSQELVDRVAATSNPTPDEEKEFAISLVGKEYIPKRALESVQEIGKTLVGRPQLYSTVSLDGGLAVYAVRQILLGSKISGRYLLSLDNVFKEPIK